MALFRLVGSKHIRNFFEFSFLTTTRLDTQSVGSSTFTMYPSDSSSFNFSFNSYWRENGTRRGALMMGVTVSSTSIL